MKADQQKFNNALMEAVDAVNDVISISKKARRIGTIKQFLSRIRNSRISIHIGRKKNQTAQLKTKTIAIRNVSNRSPYGIHPC